MNISDVAKQYLIDNKGSYICYLIVIIALYSIEALVVPKQTSKLIASVSQLSNVNIEDVTNNFYSIIFIWGVAQCLSILDDYMRSDLNPKFDEHISNTILNALILKNKENYEELDQGLIVSKLLTIPKIIKQISRDILQILLPKGLVIILISSYFFYLNFNIGIVCVLLIIIYLRNYKDNETACNDTILNYNSNYEDLTKLIGDKIQNLPSIYSLGKELDEIKIIKDRNSVYYKNYSDVLKCSLIFKARGYIINILFFVVLNFVNLYLFKNQKIDAKDFSTVFIISIYLIQYLGDLSVFLPDLLYNFGLLDGNNEFLKVLDIKTDSNKPDFVIKTGSVEFKNVSFSYNGKTDVLENINISIKGGETIGILGNSGSGKSTIIKLLMRYYSIIKGEIFVDGQDISKVNLLSYRKMFSYVSQNTKLFNTSIYDNIRYGTNITNDNIDEAIKRFGILNIFENIQYNLNTSSGLGGEKLSGGQKQVILVLRAFFNNKPIVILDEPISAIDSSNKVQVINLIKNAMKDRTVIIITHDESILSIVNRTYQIVKGKIQNLNYF